jgi:hypothetical protein
MHNRQKIKELVQAFCGHIHTAAIERIDVLFLDKLAIL